MKLGAPRGLGDGATSAAAVLQASRISPEFQAGQCSRSSRVTKPGYFSFFSLSNSCLSLLVVGPIHVRGESDLSVQQYNPSDGHECSLGINRMARDTEDGALRSSGGRVAFAKAKRPSCEKSEI